LTERQREGEIERQRNGDRLKNKEREIDRSAKVRSSQRPKERKER